MILRFKSHWFNGNHLAPSNNALAPSWHNDMVIFKVDFSIEDDLSFPNQVAIAANGYFQRKGAPKLLPMFATNFMASMEAITWQ